MKIEKNDMVMVYDGGGTVPHCKYTGRFGGGYAADRFARKCAAQGLWCSLHGLAVADGSCEWVEISAC